MLTLAWCNLCLAVNPYLDSKYTVSEWKKFGESQDHVVFYYDVNHVGLFRRDYVDVWVKRESPKYQALNLYRLNMVNKTYAILDNVICDSRDIFVVEGTFLGHPPKGKIGFKPIQSSGIAKRLSEEVCNVSDRTLIVSPDYSLVSIPEDDAKKWFYMTSLSNNTWNYINLYSDNSENKKMIGYLDKEHIMQEGNTYMIWTRVKIFDITGKNRTEGHYSPMEVDYILRYSMLNLDTGKCKDIYTYSFDSKGRLLSVDNNESGPLENIAEDNFMKDVCYKLTRLE